VESPDSPKDDESTASSDEGAKEQEKVLKSLAFPEIETGSFSADWCPKINKCISKRLTKLELQLTQFPPVEKQTSVQQQWGP